jgi:transcription elongation factor SPT6
MQLRDFPVTAVPEGSDELDDEAEWIYKQAFCKPTISNQVCTVKKTVETCMKRFFLAF